MSPFFYRNGRINKKYEDEKNWDQVVNVSVCNIIKKNMNARIKTTADVSKCLSHRLNFEVFCNNYDFSNENLKLISPRTLTKEQQ